MTIRKNITDRKEFEKRFKSIATNVFPEIYLDWLRVFERQQRGAWHAHVVVATKEDIRTGTDVVALNQLLKDKRDRKTPKAIYYSSIKRLAPENLRGIWKEFRRLDTKTIAQRIENSLQFGIDHKIISPFMQRTSDLASEVLPTLEKIQAAAAEAKSEWSKRIWKTAWTTSLIWSIGPAILCIWLFCLKIGAYYGDEMAVQTADMAQVMKFNQEAFRKLVIAQVPVRVVPVQNDDGTPNPRGFALLIEGAYAAEMRPLDGQKTGCIFFNSDVPAKQIQQLQQATLNPTQPTNDAAK